MSDKTSAQLKEEAAMAETAAAKTKAEINKQQVLLSQQKAQLAKLQAAVVEYGQLAVTNPSQQQIYADAIVKLNTQIKNLNNSINSITININNLFTTYVNEIEQANNLNQQAQAAENVENGTTTIPPPVAPVPNAIVVNESTITTLPVDDGTTQGIVAASATPVNTVPQPVSANQGPAFDPDTGLPYPGFAFENGEYYYVGPDYVDPSTKASANQSRATAVGLALKKAQEQATQQDAINAQLKNDWRVKLTLAPNSTYLYNDPKAPGILAPLKITKGVIFPYTPQISVSYSAVYDPTMLTHSNYKINQYQGSAVDSVSISCMFTAQDTNEANYLLAVIHFFRAVTKMFYGKDENPDRGTPPPLCYLTGLGAFQFDNHPLVITNFNYSLPDDVDYIRAATNTTTMPGQNTSASEVKPNLPSFSRLPRYISPGGTSPAPLFRNTSGTINPTYVPTKINLQIQALPIVSRNDISNNFSLRKYANGELLQGSKNKNQGGGFW